MVNFLLKNLEKIKINKEQLAFQSQITDNSLGLELDLNLYWYYNLLYNWIPKQPLYKPLHTYIYQPYLIKIIIDLY